MSSYALIVVLLSLQLCSCSVAGECAVTTTAEFTINPALPTSGKNFHTLPDALSAVRATPTPRNVTITIASPPKGNDATLRFTESVVITDEESCLKIAGEETTAGDHIRCDKPVPIDAVVPVSDEATLDRIDPRAKGHLYSIDIQAMNISHVTQWPVAYSVGSSETDLFEIYYAGRLLSMARYPKPTQNMSALYPGVKCEGKDGCIGGIPMKAALTGTYHHPPGVKQNSSFEVYPQSHNFISKLVTAVPHGLYLEGNWRVDFSVTGAMVQSINTTNNTVDFACDMPNGIGWKYTSNPAGCGCEPFYAVNVVEVMSDPLDYVLDWTDRKIYIWLPNSTDSTAKEADPRSLLTIVDNNGPALILNGSHDVTIEGLSVGFTYEDGLAVDNSSSVELTGLNLHDIGGNGIKAMYASDTLVQSCDIARIGDTGIYLAGGGNYLTLQGSNNTILNNHISDAGLKGILAGEGICVTGSAVGIRIAHNLVRRVSGEGIHLGEDTTSGLKQGVYDSLVEYNEVFQVGLNGSGFAAVYACCNPVFGAGNTFRYNFIHSSPHVNGIAWDNQFSGQVGYGNVFYYVTNGYGLNHGSYNAMTNNLIIKNSPRPGATSFQAAAGISIACRGFSDVYNCSIPGSDVKAWVQQLSDVHINDTYSPWGSKFKWYLGDICQEIASTDGKNQRVTGNYVDLSAMIYIDAAYSNSGCDLPTLNNTFTNLYQLPQNSTIDPGFADYQNLNFTLKPDSPVYKALPGFKPIPFGQIGLYVDDWRRSLPTAEEIGRLEYSPSKLQAY